MFSNDAFTGDFYIINTETRKPLQSERTQELADRACKQLNEHEERNGRQAMYEVEYRGPLASP